MPLSSNEKVVCHRAKVNADSAVRASYPTKRRSEKQFTWRHVHVRVSAEAFRHTNRPQSYSLLKCVLGVCITSIQQRHVAIHTSIDHASPRIYYASPRCPTDHFRLDFVTVDITSARRSNSPALRYYTSLRHQTSRLRYESSA